MGGIFEDKKQDAFESLVGECIGEIGQLNAKIKGLPQEIKSAIEPVHKTLSSESDKLAEVMRGITPFAKTIMEREAKKQVEQMSQQVGAIANRIAGDAAEASRHREERRAIFMAIVGVLVTAFIFGAAGWVLGGWDSRESLLTAQKQAESEKARADAAIEAAKKEAADSIQEIRNTASWTGTKDGILAKRFFDIGGSVAAKCASKQWDLMVDERGQKWCIPKRRSLIGNDEISGWKIP